MIFGVHNHYHNNSHGVGHMEHPDGRWVSSQMPVRLSKEGLVIFNLDECLDLQQKIRLASLLHVALKKEFGLGISFATCSDSDCLEPHEVEPYYTAMKSIDPAIVTIFADFCGDDEVAPSVDFCIEGYNGIKTVQQIAACVGVASADTVVPAQGWDAFSLRLEQIFEQAKESALSSEMVPVRGQIKAKKPLF